MLPLTKRILILKGNYKKKKCVKHIFLYYMHFIRINEHIGMNQREGEECTTCISF